MSEASPAPTTLTALADWHLAEALRADDRGDERTRDFHNGAAEVIASAHAAIAKAERRS